jgi:hypothetical protein
MAFARSQSRSGTTMNRSRSDSTCPVPRALEPNKMKTDFHPLYLECRPCQQKLPFQSIQLGLVETLSCFVYHCQRFSQYAQPSSACPPFAYASASKPR